MDIPVKKKEEINNIAKKVNSSSEEYQLIHATFAIEKLCDATRKELYEIEFSSIRKEIAIARKNSDKDAVEFWLNKAKVMTSNYQNTKIQVEYLPQIKDGCARTCRSENGVFSISLPDTMKKIRSENGDIDFNKMKNLRKLMAHELGHIMLHADHIASSRADHLGDFGSKISEMEELEADYFADELIALRKERNREIHEHKKYDEF